MLPLSLATNSAPRFTPANDVIAQAVVPSTLLIAGNSARTMEILSVAKPEVATPDIAPPVLLRNPLSTATPDFIDQADLDERWEDLQTQLETVTEKEALAILSSGILQTEPGIAFAGPFEAALLRSVRPKGAITQARLTEIIKVICHLPPAKWAAALGENLGFVDGTNDPGLKGFLHTQMEHSRTVRDEKIANKELLSDPHLNRLNELVKEGRSYIRSSDGELHTALKILADARDLRPSPKAACTELTAFIDVLEHKDVPRVRWPDHYVERVKALRDEIKPNDDTRAGWLDVLTATSWLKWVFGGTDSSPTATDAANPASSNEDVPPLLATLQAFERSGDFYTHVTGIGPKIPNGFAGKVLWACNALDTFGLLKMDTRHIATGPGRSAVFEPEPEPSPGRTHQAWKNGASDVPWSPLEPGPAPVDPLIMLGQFAAQADDILNQIASVLVPWNSAYAEDHGELKVLIEELPNDPDSQTTTGVSPDSPADFSAIGERVSNLLVRVRGDLLGAGAAVLGRAGELVLENPGKAVGVFALYMAASDFLINWFLPEPQPMVDPLQDVFPAPDTEPDEASVIHQYMVEEVMGLFDEIPDVVDKVKKMISESDYDDPADDPQLNEDIQTLLQQPIPGLQNVTYQAYLQELYPLGALEASEESEDPVSATTNEPALAAFTHPLASETPTGARQRRSAGDYPDQSTVTVSALNCRDLLIEAGQRALDADISIQAGEEIAPGFTISQAAEMFSADFVELQTVLDPKLFVLSFTEKLVAGSDLPADLKSEVNYQTKFKVEYFLERPASKYRHAMPDKTKRYEIFSLADLLMGRHETKTKPFENLTILWPAGYTGGFKRAVEDSNMWGDYKERLEKVSTQPRFYELWKSGVQFSLRHLIEDYRNGTASALGREVADKYLRGDIKVRPVAIRQGRYSDPIRVPNVVFLTTASQGRDAREGLFVFLGGDEKVIESPVELFEDDGKSIEEFPTLRDELSNRIPLKDLLSRDDDDFKYSQGRFVGDWNPIEMFKNYKWPYTPILFGRRDGPTYYGEDHDAFKYMFEEVIDKNESDMDTLTSTWRERALDKLSEILVDSLKYGAMILALPGAPTFGLAFLMGASASAMQYARGKMMDDPLEAERHKSNAVMGLIAQTAAPYIGKVLGKVFSKAVDSRITGKVLEHLKYSGAFPERISKYFPKYGHAPSSLATNIHKIEKWIAPRVRNIWVIQDKVNRKFTNNIVVNRLKSLAKGPHVAQRLMERSRVLYFSDLKQGYVYRGFAMRGDMRPPREVFANGLKSDGAKASGYYDSNGAGAFYDGGKKGGWTYLIDGRTIDGKDVLRNRNWQAGSGARLGSNPYEISYLKRTPGSMILGAYDGAGKFIPNPKALRNAIKSSVPNPFVDAIRFPLKDMVQNKNAEQAPIKLPS